MDKILRVLRMFWPMLYLAAFILGRMSVQQPQPQSSIGVVGTNSPASASRTIHFRLQETVRLAEFAFGLAQLGYPKGCVAYSFGQMLGTEIAHDCPGDAQRLIDEAICGEEG